MESPLRRCKPSPSTSPWPDVHLPIFLTIRQNDGEPSETTRAVIGPLTTSCPVSFPLYHNTTIFKSQGELAERFNNGPNLRAPDGGSQKVWAPLQSSLKYYKDTQMSANVGLEVPDCVKKWRRIRNKFVRQKKAIKGSSGDAGGQKVPAFDLFLSWLTPHIKHRETVSNYDEKVNISWFLNSLFVDIVTLHENLLIPALCLYFTISQS